MQEQPSRIYETVHFPEYLDNGTADIAPANLLKLHSDPSLLANTSGFKATRRTNLPDLPDIETQTTINPPIGRNHWYLANLTQTCSEILGEPVINISFPGGSFRKSCRIHLSDNRSLIASHRLPGRAVLETAVINTLARVGQPVPQVMAFNGLLLLQEDLSGESLDHVIEYSRASQFNMLADKALYSLQQIHQAAELQGLDRAVPMIGYNHEWLVKFLDRTAVLGGFMGLPAPFIPVEQLFDLLVPLKPRFLKWDARPGNAMLLPNDNIAWFDWEHCAARNRLDDMAWFLCDDKIPDYPAVEEELIQQHLMAFADGRSFEHAHDYLRLYGVLHMCTRLGRLLDMKAQHSWDQLDQFLARPQPGTSLAQAKRLCTRAGRWAGKMQAIAHLAHWFAEITPRLEKLP